MQMVRVSSLPFKNFEYNIKRAMALARLDDYLEDILHNEGRRTIGAFLNVPKELMRTLEINKLVRECEEKFEEHFKAKYKKKGKQHFENLAKDLMKRLKPQIKKISEIFEDLGLLMEQTLLEQALVVAVSAFEVYLKELVVSIVTLNKNVRKRFFQEIDSKLSLEKLLEYEEDAKRTQGEIVAGRVRLETRSIKSLFKRLIGNENIFGDLKTERRIKRILEKRHLIIHRAGTVDPKYKKTTKHKGAIDRQIKISRAYVLRSITALEKLVKRVEALIH